MQYLMLTTLTAMLCYSHSIYAAHLLNAVNNKEISIAMQGASTKDMPEAMRSGGFAPKLEMDLKNNTDAPLKVELEEGYMMEPEQAGYQALLLTKPMVITLKPKSTQKEFLYAMCTQLSMSSPNTTIKYKVGKKAPDALLRMAQYIARNNYQNFGAQQAVWCLSDNSPVLSVDAGNNTVTNSLQQMVADLKGVDLEQLKRENQGRDLSQIMQAFNGKRIDRNIVFKNDTACTVTVGYYSEQGELMRPLMENVLFKAGEHSIRYNPYPVSLTNNRYSVCLVKDGEIYRQHYFMQ